MNIKPLTHSGDIKRGENPHGEIRNTCGYTDVNKVTARQLVVTLRNSGLYPKLPQLHL